MRIPVPDVIPPASELGRVHFVGIGGAGLSAIARIMAQQGVAGHRQRRPGHAVPAVAARARRAAATSRLRRRARRRRRHRSWSPPPPATTTPRCSRRRARGLRILPRSAGLKSAMAGQRRGRRRRHPRQDHHHLDAHHGAAAPRRGPDVRDRRGARPRPAATPTPAAATCSWPRPTRATAPSSSTDPTPPLVTNVDADHLDVWGTEEAYRAAFADFVAHDGRRTASLVVCGDDPGAARAAGARAGARPDRALGRGGTRPRLAGGRRRPGRLDAVVRALAGRAHGRHGSPCRCPGGTTCSTPRPPW